MFLVQGFTFSLLYKGRYIYYKYLSVGRGGGGGDPPHGGRLGNAACANHAWLCGS